MEKEHEILRDKVMRGTQRAIDKLIIQSKKDGRELVISENGIIKKIDFSKESKENH
ncbi:MAG: hypothetical protein HW421_1281 [Ignavibacteria bacterium]|nr:hypothetical protein [Ignavibacteria bacterium]